MRRPRDRSAASSCARAERRPRSSARSTTLLPKFGIAVSLTPLDFHVDLRSRCAGDARDRLRHGRSDRARSRKRDPERDFIGVEVHGPGVGSLLNRIDADGAHERSRDSPRRRRRRRDHDRGRVACGHPRLLPGSVAEEAPSQAPADDGRVRSRARAASRSPAATCTSATDWEDYAQRDAGDARPPSRCSRTPATGFAPRPPWRPLTKFESARRARWARRVRSGVPRAASALARRRRARTARQAPRSRRRARSAAGCSRRRCAESRFHSASSRYSALDRGGERRARSSATSTSSPGHEVHALDRRRGRNDRQAVAHREIDLALDAGAVAQRRDRNAAAGEEGRDVRRRNPVTTKSLAASDRIVDGTLLPTM